MDATQVDRDLRRLAADIIHCPLLAAALGGVHSPCREVVSWQSLDPAVPRYVPEPWRGHLAIAPILFISSNPSAGEQGAPLDPNWWGSLHGTEDLLTSFDPGRWPGVADAIYCRDARGRRIGSWVRYWAWNRQIAAELLGRQPVPGRDYALTEVVHCASRHEHGVAAAVSTCTARYLERILHVSAAKIVVLAGRTAHRAFQDVTGAHLTDGWWGPGALAGKTRILIRLPHPNARGPKKGVSGNLGTERTRSATSFLLAAKSAPR